MHWHYIDDVFIRMSCFRIHEFVICCWEEKIDVNSWLFLHDRELRKYVYQNKLVLSTWSTFARSRDQSWCWFNKFVWWTAFEHFVKWSSKVNSNWHIWARSVFKIRSWLVVMIKMSNDRCADRNRRSILNVIWRLRSYSDFLMWKSSRFAHMRLAAMKTEKMSESNIELWKCYLFDAWKRISLRHDVYRSQRILKLRNYCHSNLYFSLRNFYFISSVDASMNLSSH
jgi:hypothetical protein